MSNQTNSQENDIYANFNFAVEPNNLQNNGKDLSTEGHGLPIKDIGIIPEEEGKEEEKSEIGTIKNDNGDENDDSGGDVGEWEEEYPYPPGFGDKKINQISDPTEKIKEDTIKVEKGEQGEQDKTDEIILVNPNKINKKTDYGSMIDLLIENGGKEKKFKYDGSFLPKNEEGKKPSVLRALLIAAKSKDMDTNMDEVDGQLGTIMSDALENRTQCYEGYMQDASGEVFSFKVDNSFKRYKGVVYIFTTEIITYRSASGEQNTLVKISISSATDRKINLFNIVIADCRFVSSCRLRNNSIILATNIGFFEYSLIMTTDTSTIVNLQGKRRTPNIQNAKTRYLLDMSGPENLLNMVKYPSFLMRGDFYDDSGDILFTVEDSKIRYYNRDINGTIHNNNYGYFLTDLPYLRVNGYASIGTGTFTGEISMSIDSTKSNHVFTDLKGNRIDGERIRVPILDGIKKLGAKWQDKLNPNESVYPHLPTLSLRNKEKSVYGVKRTLFFYKEKNGVKYYIKNEGQQETESPYDIIYMSEYTGKAYRSLVKRLGKILREDSKYGNKLTMIYEGDTAKYKMFIHDSDKNVLSYEKMLEKLSTHWEEEEDIEEEEDEEPKPEPKPELKPESKPEESKENKGGAGEIKNIKKEDIKEEEDKKVKKSIGHVMYINKKEWISHLSSKFYQAGDSDRYLGIVKEEKKFRFIAIINGNEYYHSSTEFAENCKEFKAMYMGTTSYGTAPLSYKIDHYVLHIISLFGEIRIQDLYVYHDVGENMTLGNMKGNVYGLQGRNLENGSITIKTHSISGKPFSEVGPDQDGAIKYSITVEVFGSITVVVDCMTRWGAENSSKDFMLMCIRIIHGPYNISTQFFQMYFNEGSIVGKIEYVAFSLGDNAIIMYSNINGVFIPSFGRVISIPFEIFYKTITIAGEEEKIYFVFMLGNPVMSMIIITNGAENRGFEHTDQFIYNVGTDGEKECGGDTISNMRYTRFIRKIGDVFHVETKSITTNKNNVEMDSCIEKHGVFLLFLRYKKEAGITYYGQFKNKMQQKVYYSVNPVPDSNGDLVFKRGEVEIKPPKIYYDKNLFDSKQIAIITQGEKELKPSAPEIKKSNIPNIMGVRSDDEQFQHTAQQHNLLKKTSVSSVINAITSGEYTEDELKQIMAVMNKSKGNNASANNVTSTNNTADRNRDYNTYKNPRENRFENRFNAFNNNEGNGYKQVFVPKKK